MVERRNSNWIDQAIRQTRDDPGGQGNTLILAMVIIVTIIGALYLAQASRTAATGRRIQELEGKREQLQLQNEQLRAEISALQSVPRLIREAEKLGFTQARADDVYYLELDDVPVSSASADVDEDDQLPAYDETLERWLREKLTQFGAGPFAPAGESTEEDTTGEESNE